MELRPYMKLKATASIEKGRGSWGITKKKKKQQPHVEVDKMLVWVLSKTPADKAQQLSTFPLAKRMHYRTLGCFCFHQKRTKFRGRRERWIIHFALNIKIHNQRLYPLLLQALSSLLAVPLFPEIEFLWRFQPQRLHAMIWAHFMVRFGLCTREPKNHKEVKEQCIGFKWTTANKFRPESTVGKSGENEIAAERGWWSIWIAHIREG